MRSPDPERETMPIAGGAGEAPVSNAWWRGWKWRPHRQHERTPAWSLYRRGHRPPASAIRADQDGADYPRRDRRAEIVERQRADRTTAQAPARCWSKARFGPLLALAKAPALLTEGAVPESSKPPTLPLRRRVRAPARGAAPKIKGRSRRTRSNGGRSVSDKSKPARFNSPSSSRSSSVSQPDPVIAS